MPDSAESRCEPELGHRAVENAGDFHGSVRRDERFHENVLVQCARVLATMCTAGGIAHSVAVAARQSASLPRVPFDDVGACPFEGCVYL